MDGSRNANSLGDALAGALARGEFVLAYQPKARCDTGRLAGAEALIRWNRGGETVSPAEFLPLLVRTGQIVDVGVWVVSEACRQMRSWLDSGLSAMPVAVNVSSIQLGLPTFFDHVYAALNANALDPRLLEIEITESCLIEQRDNAVATLTRLRKLGVRVSLDDFGTGFSSLGLLSQLPVDAIKIDRTFVQGMTKNPEAAAITHAIIDLARNLRLSTVAEGVETAGQLARLRARKCDYVQGHLYSKPLCKADLEAFARSDAKLPDLERADREPSSRTLLLVDDEPNILSSLKRLLRPDGYRVLTAPSGSEGLEVLAANEVDVVISDQRMPGMTGVEFLRRVKELRPDVVRIVLSGFTDLQSITNAINEGAIYKFLAKPWDDDLLRSNIVEALRRKEMTDENRRLAAEVKAAKEQLEVSNAELNRLVEESNSQIDVERAALDLSQEIVQQIPWPILGIDEGGLIALANASAERALATDRPLLGAFVEECLPAPLAHWLADSAASAYVVEGAQRLALTRHALVGASGAHRLLVVGSPVH